MGEDYWHFRLRPQGIIEILCGEGCTQFVTTLPKNANRDIVLELLVTVLPPAVLDSNEAQRGGASQQIGGA